MKSEFGQTFLFLADLAWKSRITVPILISAAFMIMDINMQVRFSIRGEGMTREIRLLSVGRISLKLATDDSNEIDLNRDESSVLSEVRDLVEIVQDANDDHLEESDEHEEEEFTSDDEIESD